MCTGNKFPCMVLHVFMDVCLLYIWIMLHACLQVDADSSPFDHVLKDSFNLTLPGTASCSYVFAMHISHMLMYM